jgi:hypothetical protein
MGFNIKYHPAKEGIPGAGAPRRPLAILAGWMGAKERQLKPYMQFYHKRGVDTLSFAVGPKHILFPQHATDQMQEVGTACACAALCVNFPHIVNRLFAWVVVRYSTPPAIPGSSKEHTTTPNILLLR